MDVIENTYEAHIRETEILPFIYHPVTDVRFRYSAHANWHENIEFIYVIGGKGKILCGCDEYVIECGDIFVVNSNLSHDIVSDSQIRYRCLIPDRNYCLLHGIDTSALIYSNYIRDEKARTMFDRLHEEYISSKPFAKASVMCAMLEFLIYVSENYTNGKGEKMKPDENITLAIGYIKSHLEKRMTLDELSAQVGLNKYYFVREFKKVTGYSPIEFVNFLRIESAKKMMTEKGLSVGEAASKAGFSDLAYFSKTFKKFNGSTPTEFIRRTH